MKTTGMLKMLCLAIVSIILLTTGSVILQGCEKSADSQHRDQETNARKRPKPTNPPPLPFYFNNCGLASAFNGNFVAGIPTTATVTLNYINSPGGSYPAFTSATVNGIKFTAPAGTLNIGSGSITFSASGTPVTPGHTGIAISVGGSTACVLPILVLNPPPSGNCVGDPAATIGSTSCVTFNYQGQTVKYSTVRAADGKVWLQQSLGSPQVAINRNDTASFGHYFQWGRWDDGHQIPRGPSITGSSNLQNPSHIAAGNPNFIKGSDASTAWWGTGGQASDTWSGTTVTSTNGKDPCTALGSGWRLPTAAEWTNVLNLEFISDNHSAFLSRLKLAESGYRSFSNAAWTPNFVNSFYWTSNADNGNAAQLVFIDAAYGASVGPAERGYGFPCRCVKN